MEIWGLKGELGPPSMYMKRSCAVKMNLEENGDRHRLHNIFGLSQVKVILFTLMSFGMCV